MSKLKTVEVEKVYNLLSDYQTLMKLNDWNVSVSQTLVEDDETYARLSDIDTRSKTAIFSLTTGWRSEDINLDRLVIHELSHLMLRNLRETFFNVIRQRDEFIQDNIIGDTKAGDPLLNWANSQSKFIEQLLIEEEEKICHTMEDIFILQS